jgi:cytochrome P450
MKVATQPIAQHPGKLLSGSYDALLSGPADFYSNVAWEHGGIAGFRVFNQRSIAVAHPDLVHQVLVTQLKKFPKSHHYDNVAQMIGDGLVTLEGATWRSDRKVIQPGFHQKSIIDLLETTSAACENVFGRWKQEGPVERAVMPEMREIGLHVISETLFGTRLEVMQQRKFSEDILEASALLTRKNWSLVNFPKNWPTPLNRRLNEIRAGLIDFLKEQVDRRIEQGVGVRGDMLDLLLLSNQSESEDSIPMERVLDEMLTLFAAGYDTTSGALSWATYFLGLHPEVLERAREEVDAVLGQREPTWEDVERLEYLQCIFYETIRLRGPIHTLSRTCAERTQIGDYVIEQGALLMVSLHGANRSPSHWEDPESFNPDRFADGAYDEKAFVSFASGSRRCIGRMFATLEAKVVLAQLVRAFDFELPSNTLIKARASAAQQPDNLRVTFKTRQF